MPDQDKSRCTCGGNFLEVRAGDSLAADNLFEGMRLAMRFQKAFPSSGQAAAFRSPLPPQGDDNPSTTSHE